MHTDWLIFFIITQVQRDKISIYASLQVQLSAVKLSTFLTKDILLTSFKEVHQKARKANDNVHVILNKIHLSLFTASLQSFKAFNL